MEEIRELNRKHDSYCQYENLSKLLQRFSFDEKMRAAFVASCQSIHYYRYKRTAEAHPLPWCTETLVMLAMEAKEYRNDDFRGKNYIKFNKMQDAALNATGIIHAKCGRFSFVDIFLVCTSLIQFQLQKCPWIEQFRFWKLFNDNSDPVHLKDVFIGKMGTTYDDYIVLANFLTTVFMMQHDMGYEPLPQKAYHYLFGEKYPAVAKNLTISRDKYVELQKEYTKGSSDPYRYVYSLRPSYRYAFVDYQGMLYCPLPHLLYYNVAGAMMHRITDGDRILRKEIGKHLLEQYLLSVIEKSEQFEEVFPEQIYRHKGSESKSPDVLARKGHRVIFFESKSAVPNIGLRLYEPEAYESNIEIISGDIKKLVTQIQRFSSYNPFRGAVSDQIDDYWGVIVVQEDCLMNRKYYFESAAQMLDYSEGSPERNWLNSHIIVTDIYEVEYAAYSGCDFFEGLARGFRWGAEDAKGYVIVQNSTFYNEVESFTEEYSKKRILELTQELSSKGLLEK